MEESERKFKAQERKMTKNEILKNKLGDQYDMKYYHQLI